MNRLVPAAFLGITSIAAIAGIGLARLSAGDAPALVDPFTEPVRTAPPAPAAPAIPAVPREAKGLEPLTFVLVSTWDGGHGHRRTTEQRVTRGTDRAHLVLGEGRHEWYFERNPSYPDRVSGALVDHDRKQVFRHEDSQLRTILGLRGWADVLMMRLDLEVLGRLRDTGRRRQVAGASFHQYVAENAAASGVVEVWWSPRLLLPLAIESRESGSVTVSARIRALQPAVDLGVLEDPEQRFPSYAVLDISDAGEHR